MNTKRISIDTNFLTRILLYTCEYARCKRIEIALGGNDEYKEKCHLKYEQAIEDKAIIKKILEMAED